MVASFAVGFGMFVAAWVVFKRWGRVVGPDKTATANLFRFWMVGVLVFSGIYVLLLTTSYTITR